jgi:Domain of unknown function (DUF4232)
VFTHDTTDTPNATAPSPEPSQLPHQLRVTYGPIEAGSGHRGMPVIFTNIGQSICRLSGYPKMTALNAKGEPIAQAQPTPSGYLGGLKSGATLPRVDLLPGQSASTMVEAMAFEAASACGAGSSLQAQPASILMQVEVSGRS